MNGRGQVALLGFAIGIIIFLLGMSFINPLKDVLDETRAADQLDCANTSISDGQKMTCLVTDAFLPYFILAVLAVGGAWVTTRVI